MRFYKHVFCRELEKDNRLHLALDKALGNLIRRKGMKKFVLLAVIAVLALGLAAQPIKYRVSVRTNDIPQIFEVYRNGAYMGMTNGDNPVEFASNTVGTLTGLWTIEPAPAGYFWAPPVQFTVLAGYFTPNNNYSIELSWNLYDVEITPVELSSFTATLTAQNNVQISWVTQSESNMLGYRIYRNSNINNNGSVLITPTLIPATNTSETQNYTVVDNEVEVNQTYFYWLESVEPNQSLFHGPVSVNVQGEVPPVYPQVSTLKNAYPNPFKANSSTNINVDVKEGENATLSIYNLQGKLVKTFKVGQGSHNISWNGADTNGKACGSGIYLYKLSTQTTNQTKKMVIIK